MIEIDVSSTDKHIRFGDEEYLAVGVYHADLHEEIVTLYIKSDKEKLLTMRKIYSEDGGFNISMTTSSGNYYRLQFVRNIK